MILYTLYYSFSITFVLTATLAITSLIFFRTKGKTRFGRFYSRIFGGVPSKESYKLATNRNLAITILIALACVANLIYCVHLILNLESSGNYPLLVGMPIFLGIIGVIVFIDIRNKLSPSKQK
jgi:hypothetical protein